MFHKYRICLAIDCDLPKQGSGMLMDKAPSSRGHNFSVNNGCQSVGFGCFRSLILLILVVPVISNPCELRASSLSGAEARRIGRKIWQNECNGTIPGLTSWNSGENFASLGIGHFIWYPEGQRGPFEESFPPLLTYLKESGVTLPAWLADSHGCPWPDRAAFLADLHSAR